MKAVITVFLLLIFGLVASPIQQQENFDFRKRAHEIADDSAIPLGKKYNLVLGGKGGGMMYNVELITFHFFAYRNLTKEQLRIIIVEIVEDMIQRFQEHPEMTPYIKNPPFNVQNADIMITVIRRPGKKNNSNTTMTAFTSRDRVFYITRDQSLAIVNEDIESYEEAKRIVQESGISF